MPFTYWCLFTCGPQLLTAAVTGRHEYAGLFLPL